MTCSGIPLIPVGKASCQRLWRDGARGIKRLPGDHVDIVSILADNSNPQGAVEKQKFIFYKMYSILYRRTSRGFKRTDDWHTPKSMLFLHSSLGHMDWMKLDVLMKDCTPQILIFISREYTANLHKNYILLWNTFSLIQFEFTAFYSTGCWPRWMIHIIPKFFFCLYNLSTECNNSFQL